MSAIPVKALLFDLGGVLIDFDFTRALRAWAAFSSLSFEELRDTFQHDLAYQRHETGEISTKDYFNSLRASLKLDAGNQQIEAGWNAIFVGEISQTIQAVRKARAKYPCWTKPLRGGNGAVGLNTKCSLIPSHEGLYHNNL